MAERLGDVRKPELGYPLDKVGGTPETRGGTVNGVQVHAVRLPSYTASVEAIFAVPGARMTLRHRSEEHTSELQSLMRISYAVFCLKKKNTHSHKLIYVKIR